MAHSRSAEDLVEGVILTRATNVIGDLMRGALRFEGSPLEAAELSVTVEWPGASSGDNAQK